MAIVHSSGQACYWFAQALKDLEQAIDSQENEHHKWACFAAHQAAEKAVKALHLYLKQEAWGHVIAKLLEELPDEIAKPVDLVKKAGVLDNFYIPARYPDGHPDGAPYEQYSEIQRNQAIQYASEIIEFIHFQMA